MTTSLPGAHPSSECTGWPISTWRQHPLWKCSKVAFWKRDIEPIFNFLAQAMWPSLQPSMGVTSVSWRALCRQGVLFFCVLLLTVEWSLTGFSQILGLYILSSGITTLTESSLSTWKLSLMLIKIHKVHFWYCIVNENNKILLIEELKLSANHFIFNCLKPHSISRYHK